MAKQKSIPELEAEKAENERKLSQLRHKKQQIENRITGGLYTPSWWIVSMYFVVCKMKYIFDSESISDVSFIDKHKKVQYIK